VGVQSGIDLSGKVAVVTGAGRGKAPRLSAPSPRRERTLSLPILTTKVRNKQLIA
jgi:hypothetical protein